MSKVQIPPATSKKALQSLIKDLRSDRSRMTWLIRKAKALLGEKELKQRYQ